MFRKKKNTFTFHQKKKIITPKLIQEIFSWIMVSVLAVFMAFVIVTAFGMQVKVIGDSMEPTIGNGQGVLVNRLVFKLFGPKEGDVVIFLPNGNTNSHYYVKRVVACPGDKVQIIDGSLYVNGQQTESEKDEYDKMEDAGIAASELKLGSGEYFLLGDNRNSSEDSRSANIGVVTTKMMVGKAWFKLGGQQGSGGFILN
ncbi:signal peptidase I [Butyrivibrio sp. DSM 10294]|uniref:signal peptidase I n=1 Tax=Butyrivibrio sp. DSM 10294 TaxID=2972457 RepID=UPI00234E49F0|nr:signal peptidase I [Butyrivibrio sp. DSM 10294]MDC7295150.1 signal peptidase I [Butyrivibrio sp. DSM 10294]